METVQPVKQGLKVYNMISCDQLVLLGDELATFVTFQDSMGYNYFLDLGGGRYFRMEILDDPETN